MTKSGTNEIHGSAYVYQRNDDLQRKEPYLGNFYTTQYGFSAGGPIVKDKVFFFVNPEFQKKAIPASGVFVGDGTTLTQPDAFSTTLNTFATSLSTYGLTGLGDGGKVSNTNPLSNIFARIDVSLPCNSTLMLRDNYAHAEQDVFSRGASVVADVFPLTSNLYQFTSTKNAPVAQLRTNFSNGSYNEFIAGFHAHSRSARNAGSAPDGRDGVRQRHRAALRRHREFVAGECARSGHHRADGQLYVADRLEAAASRSVRRAQWYKVRNLFGQNSVGLWTFGTMDSLLAGTPAHVPGQRSGDGRRRRALPRRPAWRGTRQDELPDAHAEPERQLRCASRQAGLLHEPALESDGSSRSSTATRPTYRRATSRFRRAFGFNWNATHGPARTRSAAASVCSRVRRHTCGSRTPSRTRAASPASPR